MNETSKQWNAHRSSNISKGYQVVRRSPGNLATPAKYVGLRGTGERDRSRREGRIPRPLYIVEPGVCRPPKTHTFKATVSQEITNLHQVYVSVYKLPRFKVNHGRSL